MRSSRRSAARDRRPGERLTERRRFLGLGVTWGLLGAVLLLALPVSAADWGTIAPGVTTIDEVRARYGAATKTEKLKVEGYDTEQWTYEGARAPAGIRRMIVDFGLLRPDGYRSAIVRTLRLEPRPGVFARRWVVLGWGLPDRDATIEGILTFFYRSGLLVYFDKDMENAATMVFTLPQPEPPSKAGR